jgi:hypothetical protein
MLQLAAPEPPEPSFETALSGLLRMRSEVAF